MKIISILLLAIVLTGCGSQITRSTDVIEKPRTCYSKPEKPELTRVDIEVLQLIDGRWAITIDDDNFNSLISNQIKVDVYIENSYNTLNKYETDCKE